MDMSESHVSRDDTGDYPSRSVYRVGTVLHGVGVLLSVGALVLIGPDSPQVGLPIAVGILIGLGLPSSPPSSAPATVLKVIHGSILRGGMKRVVLVKLLFAAALLYAGSYPVLFGTGELVVPRLLLGSALGVSGIGSELEARWIDRLIAQKSGGDRNGS